MKFHIYFCDKYVATVESKDEEDLKRSFLRQGVVVTKIYPLGNAVDIALRKGRF